MSIEGEYEIKIDDNKNILEILYINIKIAGTDIG